MREEGRRRARMRWVTVGEAVAIAAVIISGLGLYNSWQDRKESAEQRAAESARASAGAPFAIRATVTGEGSALSLQPLDPGQAIQAQTIRFPPSFGVTPVSTTGDPRIEAGWFADALKRARRDRKLPDETPGDARMPVLIETDFLSGGETRHARALYDLGYSVEGRFLRGGAVKLHGLSLIGKAPPAAKAEARLAALWAAR